MKQLEAGPRTTGCMPRASNPAGVLYYQTEARLPPQAIPCERVYIQGVVRWGTRDNDRATTSLLTLGIPR